MLRKKTFFFSLLVLVLELVSTFARSHRPGVPVWAFQAWSDQHSAQKPNLTIDSSDGISTLNLGSTSGASANASYSLVTDANGQSLIQATGVDAVITLVDVKAGVDAIDNSLLVDQGNGVWLLNTSLLIGTGVTLNLVQTSNVKELRLRSDKNTLMQSSGAILAPEQIDYSSFIYLRTDNGTINLDDMKIYSWDYAANKVDENYTNGRAYLLAKYAATMNIRNSEISYLGSPDGESYGITWRDINDTAAPDVLRTRVTGEVINSNIHHNYYGVYTYQAGNMIFRGNTFHNNVYYGSNFHNYSHHFLLENNTAYANGAHSFIISRGCNNFIFRNNIAYNNLDLRSSQAHAFMVDPGSPNSIDPQAPSYENLFENNEAYNNEGSALYILGSNNNQILNNYFHQNEVGISLGGSSIANTIRGNQLTQNTLSGVYLREAADSTTISSNQISSNGDHGIYVRSSNNIISQNIVTGNQKAGISLKPENVAVALHNNEVISNSITGNISDGVLVSDASTVRNRISRNSITGNGGSAIKIDGSAQQGIQPPIITIVQVGGLVQGTALANATVEVYLDPVDEAQIYLGTTPSDGSGAWQFQMSDSIGTQLVTALVIDGNGNTSALSSPASVTSTPTPTATATPTASPTSTASPTVTPTATATPPSSSGDAYETDDTCAEARSIATDGSEQEHTFHRQADSDHVQFTATANTTYRVEVQVPNEAPTDVTLELYTDCERTPDERWTASFSPNVRLDFKAPANGPIYLRLLNYPDTLFGSQFRYQISVRPLDDSASNKALIIVAGRLRGGDKLQSNIHNVTGKVYDLYQKNGYTDENIFYLSTDPQLTGVDATATKANLRSALLDWAANRLQPEGVLTLYLMDHGNPELFYIDDLNGQQLTPAELNDWLTQLEGKVSNVKSNIFIEACQSGSFIDLPGSISKTRRVVVTSTTAQNDAKASPAGAYFSDQFLTQLHQGYNLAASFSQGAQVARQAYRFQQAWLDADGDGTPNEFEDATLAAQRSFAYVGTLGGDWAPHIFSVQPPTTITNASGTIRADVRDDVKVSQVWAVVYPPDYQPPSDVRELQAETLPTFTLTPTGQPDIYAGIYPGFTQAGSYRIVVYAADNEGLSAFPRTITVGSALYLPVIGR